MLRISAITPMVLLFIAVPAWCGMGSIGKDNVHVRSGPGLKYRVIFRAPLGYPVQVIKRQKKWVKIKDWEGTVGWVYRPLLSDVMTVVLMRSSTNVRNGPGLGNDVLRKVERGEIYKVLGAKSNWIHIGYYFEEEPVGWIRRDLVFGD